MACTTCETVTVDCSCTNCTNCTNCCTCIDANLCSPVLCTDGCVESINSNCVIGSEVITICGVNYPIGTDLNVLLTALEACNNGGGTDIFVQTTANDTSSSYLFDKIVGSDCIDVTLNNATAAEYLSISPKIDTAAPFNALSCSPDGLLVGSTQLMVGDATDTCPKDFLDEKFDNDLATSGLTGYGGYQFTVTIDALGFGIVSVPSATINGVGYAVNVSSTDGGSANLITALNDFFTANGLTGLNAYLISSVVGASTEACIVAVTGIATSFTSITIGNSVIGDQAGVITANPTLINPNYFSNVYKQVNDVAGCKTISLHAYKEPVDTGLTTVDCDTLLLADVSALWYSPTTNAEPTVYISISETFQSGVDYVVDIQDASGEVLVSGFVIKQAPSSGVNASAIIPLVNYTRDSDITIFITKDCGCCATAQSGTLSFTLATILTNWIDVPAVAISNNWEVDTDNGYNSAGCQYKIEGTNVYFRGALRRRQNINPAPVGFGTASTPTALTYVGTNGLQENDEYILDVSLIPGVAAIIINAEYNLGVHDTPYKYFELNAEDVVFPELRMEGYQMAVRSSFYSSTSQPVFPYHRASLSNVVLRG